MQTYFSFASHYNKNVLPSCAFSFWTDVGGTAEKFPTSKSTARSNVAKLVLLRQINQTSDNELILRISFAYHLPILPRLSVENLSELRNKETPKITGGPFFLSPEVLLVIRSSRSDEFSRLDGSRTCLCRTNIKRKSCVRCVRVFSSPSLSQTAASIPAHDDGHTH